MSYEIVKTIKVKDNEVSIKHASNNVYPKTFEYSNSESLSKILKEEGREELDIEILRTYEQGMFQAGSKNKYTKALEILLHLPEYNAISWRTNWEESKKEESELKLKELLKQALNTELPKEKFILSKNYRNEPSYFYQRKGSRNGRWYKDIKKAIVFNFKEDAENTKKYFINSSDWQVIPIN